MAVHIRLKRQGRRKRPFYRVIAIDSRSHREGREIERLGWYDPVKEGLSVEFKEDRIFHWLGQGAIPTDTVNSLMRQKGLTYKWHLMKTGVSEDKIATEMEAWTTRQLEKAEKSALKKAEKKTAQPTSDTEESIEEVVEVEVAEEVVETKAPAEEKVAEKVEEASAETPETLTEEAVESTPEVEAIVAKEVVAENANNKEAETSVEEPVIETVEEEKTEE